MMKRNVNGRYLEIFYIFWFILVLGAYFILVIIPKVQGKA